METFPADRFVRLPTELLDALLHARLSGTQWRILLWVIRQTYGWNRQTVAFSWYGIAKQLAISRSHALLEGRRLLEGGFLALTGSHISLQIDSGLWVQKRSENRTFGKANVRNPERLPFGEPNALVRNPRQMRSESRMLFRRAKDIKDTLKTKKESETPGILVQDALAQVMDCYGAFREASLHEEATELFNLPLAKAATALLKSCSQNAQEAMDVIARIGGQLNQEDISWTLETICERHLAIRKDEA